MNILHWLAGADQRILDECTDSEKVKIAGFGALVLIPAVVGLFSMTYAISTITEHKSMIITGGIIWFFIVLYVDRFVVSTLYKSKLEEKTNFWAATIVRYLFALIVGLAVAHPMVMLWFDDSITEAIEKEKNGQYVQLESNHQARLDSLQLPLTNLKDRRDCLEKLLFAEQSGHKVSLPCGYTSGIPNIRGNFHRTREIQSRIANLQSEILRVEASVDNRIKELEHVRDQSKATIENHTSSDYLKRVRILSQLEEDDISGAHIRTVHLFIILFFVMIDILPITMKIATPYGAYEAHRDNKTFEILEKKYADRKVMKKYYNTSYLTSEELKLRNDDRINELKLQAQMVVAYIANQEESRSKFDTHIKKILLNLKEEENPETRKFFSNYLIKLRDMYVRATQQSQDKLLLYLKE